MDMIDKKTKELILRYIDGKLNDRDKDTAVELLKTNDAVAKFYENMKKLDQILEEDKFKPEEVDLTDLIMSEINQIKTDKPRNQIEGFWNRLFPDPRWNVAYALIMGVIIGFLLFSPLIRPDVGSSDTDLDEIGTMYDVNTEPAFKVPIALDGVDAEITAHHLSNDFVRIIVEMVSDEETRTRFSFNKSDFNVWTYKVIEQQFDCRILSNYNAVEVVNVGKNSYIILLKKLNDLDNEIKVEVFSGDRIVYQNILTIQK